MREELKELLRSGLVNRWLVGLLVCLTVMWTPLFLVTSNPPPFPVWGQFVLAIGGAVGAGVCGYKYTEL